jgi:hypothetical protein
VVGVESNGSTAVDFSATYTASGKFETDQKQNLLKRDVDVR